MKKYFLLFAFIFLFISFQQANAAYDFTLKAENIYTFGLDNQLTLDNIKVENGLLNYSIRYEHPIGQSKKYAGASSVSLSGEFYPKEKILRGHFKYTVSSAEDQYRTTSCNFASSPIEPEIEKVNLSFQNCMESIVNPWEGGSREEKTGLNPLSFKIIYQNAEAEEKTEAKLEDSGARFSDIYGQVEILLPTGYDANGEPIFDDEEGWNFAQLDMELPYGAKLKLKERSGIILAVPGSEPFEMKTPDNLYPDDETIIMLPLKQKGDSMLKLLGGQLYNNVKKIIKDGSMDIEMGQAVAGIKGTTFVLEERNQTSILKVLAGEVAFRSKFDNKIELVTAGEMIVADSSGLGEKTTFNQNDEAGKWNYSKPTAPPASASINKTKINYLWWLIGGMGILIALIAVKKLSKILKNKNE